MQYGNAVERLVRNDLLRNPSDTFSRQILDWLGGPNRPDFIGVGSAAGQTFDITTPGQIGALLARPYGPGLQMIHVYETAGLHRLSMRTHGMRTEFLNKVFDGYQEFDSGSTHSELALTDCRFRSCTIGLSERDLALRSLIRDVELRNCSATGCSLVAVIVEDALVDGLKTSGMLQTWATVFKHVTLKGRIDRLMFSDLFDPGWPNSEFQAIVARANAEYYATVDWALDIREADFKDFDCRGVPSRLVRRDPETQIMVTRARVQASGDQIAAGGQHWHALLKLFLESTYSDAVLVAPKRNRRELKELVAGLKELRRSGVAEDD